jgi:Protein of unknown function (DUF4231)
VPPVTEKTEPTSYAMHIADGSFAWYRTAAIRARRLYRSAEIAVIAVSALVPLSAAVLPGNTIVPAVLGSTVVVITGLRSVFHWHENYLRFSRAREAVEVERRRFRTGVEPYDDHQTRAHRSDHPDRAGRNGPVAEGGSATDPRARQVVGVTGTGHRRRTDGGCRRSV